MRWAEVFVLAEHPWLFEYHWRRRPLRRLLSTIRHACRPARFWREVRMSDPIHLRPAAVVAITVLMAVLVAIVASIVGWHHHFNQRWGAVVSGPDYWLELVGTAITAVPRLVAERALGGLLVLFGMPLLFALLPTTLRQARVRPAHIVRIGFYALVGPAVLATGWAGLHAALALIGAGGWAGVLDPQHWGRGVDGRDHGWILAAASEILGPLLMILIATGWSVVWWRRACRVYLRLPAPDTIVFSLALILILAALAVELR